MNIKTANQSQKKPKDIAADEVLSLSEQLSQAIKKLEYETRAQKPMQSLSAFPEVIYQARKLRKLSMADVADLAGISKNAYQSIEKGASSPKLETVISIAKVFGLKLWVE
ncbi:MAG TPA: XRE family transcriptional regulator [Aeromonadales bacterium]|nr:XRE family transcriptional regulator [Aeromonadales bacterium]